MMNVTTKINNIMLPINNDCFNAIYTNDASPTTNGINSSFIVSKKHAYSTAVFDIDAVGLTKVVHNLNRGVDIAGNIINPPTSILIGVGANPCAVDIDKELNHLLNKYNAGAEYIITQPVFAPEKLLSFIDKAHKMGIDLPFVAGIWPLVSLKNALFLKNEVPGVYVPDSIIEKMEGAKTKEDGLKYGVEIARGIREQINSYVNGYQISVPFGKVDVALEIIKNN